MQFHKIWQQIEDVLFLMVFMTVNNRIFDAFSVSLQNLLSTYNFKIPSQYGCLSQSWTRDFHLRVLPQPLIS